MPWREIALCLVALVASLFAGDQVMGLLGYPAEREFQVAHPESFHERRESVEFAYDFRTNGQGLRYADIPLEKPTGERRVLVLGDSFTEGVGVEAGETFSAHLERAFSQQGQGTVRFINGGLAGQGPVQYWRLLYRLGLDYRPDAVLICYYANDLVGIADDFVRDDLYRFGWGGAEAKEPGLKRALHVLFPHLYTALAELRQRFSQGRRAAQAGAERDFVALATALARDRGYAQDEIDRWLRSIDGALLKAADSDPILANTLAIPLLKRDHYKYSLDLSGVGGEQKLGEVFFIFEEMRRVAQQRGAQLWLLYLPNKWQYDPRAHDPEHPWVAAGMMRRAWLTEETAIQGRLKAWAETRSVPFLDLTGPLRARVKESGPLNYDLDEHWNAAGHETVAEIIRDWLLEQRLVESLSR